MKFKFIFSFLLLKIIFAQFDWQYDGTMIRQGLHIEWQRSGDANSDGSMIYAWSDCRTGVRDVIVQKVDKNGNNLWGENGVVAVNAPGRQEDPQLVTDGSGGAYVIWMDYRSESDTEGDIYAQHILSDGSLAWNESGAVVTFQEGRQASPNICSDGSGGAYVIWKDDGQSSYGDIYATHLSNNGIIAEGVGIPVLTYASYRSNPSLNTGGSGDAVLVWSDDRNSDQDLYAQRIRVNQSTIETEWGAVGSGGKLVCDASGDQLSPRVSQYDQDRTIITWEDRRSNYTDAYYQILDGGGNKELASGGVSACTGNWEIIKPRVKAKNSIAFIVWEDRRNSFASDIYAQKINSNGSVVWDNGLSISSEDGTQAEPRLDTDGDGGVYFVWEDQRNSDESGYDIYAQHVNSEGSATHDLNGELICNAENRQFNPLVRSDGSGGALIVWGDQRAGGSYGIYYQHLNSSGVNLDINGKESFFGIGLDSASDPFNHSAIYLNNNTALAYWQDMRGGESKIYGTLITPSFDGVSSNYFTNNDINGKQLSILGYSQIKPKVILINNKIFLSYIAEEPPEQNLYLQILNLDLDLEGNAIELSNPSTTKQGFDMIIGEDGYIYYAYSENYDISIKKINNNGSEQWSSLVVTNSADDYISSIHPLPGSGCMIIYESQSFFDGSHIYAMAIDGNGQAYSGWPIAISNLSGEQYFESSVTTDSGVFVSFKDNTSGNYDLYGQHILFTGEMSFGVVGTEIAVGTGNQEKSSVAFDSLQDIVFVCYESPDGNESNIDCNEIDITDLIVGAKIGIASAGYDQTDPIVYWSGHSFMIAWNDARLSSGANTKEDIYFQEYKNGSLVFNDDPEDGAAPLTTFSMKQEKPIISKYSDSEDSFFIFWEDNRSTGKELCTNLWGQSYTSVACADHGDCNADDGYNVLDIVLLSNWVLDSSCSSNMPPSNCCACDMNFDSGWNVLDVVAIANCVLAETCGGRVNDATESQLIIKNNTVLINADGFIGGVQMTLSHGDNFSIKMTNSALFSDFISRGNETRLLVINPKTELLFDFSGYFDIKEIIVANTQYEVPVDLPISFNLSEAYPNPFNPRTSMYLTILKPSELEVKVYNVLGQLVMTLLNGHINQGVHHIEWDASNVSSGVYFVKAQTQGVTLTHKLILLK